jgi:hypothetical protein
LSSLKFAKIHKQQYLDENWKNIKQPSTTRYKQASHWHTVKEGMPEHRNAGTRTEYHFHFEGKF